MRGITRDSLAEMMDRKIFWIFVGLTVLAVFFAMMSRKIKFDVQLGSPDSAEAMRQLHYMAIQGWANWVFFLVFLAVMTSAAVLPAMLERGRSDFYLSKPISRRSLYLSKLASVWLVYGAVVLICGLLPYVTTGMVQSFFEPRVLLFLVVALLQLLVWLTITFAAGLFTGSTSMAVVAAFLVWILQLVLRSRDSLKMLLNSDITSAILDGLYYILPKSSEMGQIGISLALRADVASWLPIWSSLLFALALTAGTLVYFRHKDY